MDEKTEEQWLAEFDKGWPSAKTLRQAGNDRVSFRVKKGEVTWIELGDDPTRILMQNGQFKQISDEELNRQYRDFISR